MVPPGVMSVPPELAVALLKERLPCEGAEDWDHVRVCPESESLTCRYDFRSFAEEFSLKLMEVLPETNVGVVFCPCMLTPW